MKNLIDKIEQFIVDNYDNSSWGETKGQKEVLSFVRHYFSNPSPEILEGESIKYNTTLSDFNSEHQRTKDIHRVGNVIFNKNSSVEDQKSWERLKHYLKRLEDKCLVKE